MDWREYFTTFIESEVQVDRTRAGVLAAKITDTFDRLN